MAGGVRVRGFPKRTLRAAPAPAPSPHKRISPPGPQSAGTGNTSGHASQWGHGLVASSRQMIGLHWIEIPGW